MYAFGWSECLFLFMIFLLVFGPRFLFAAGQRAYRGLAGGKKSDPLEPLKPAGHSD